MQKPKWTSQKKFVKSFRSMLFSGLVDLLTASQHRRCRTIMVLRWRNKFQAAMLVLVVIPKHKLSRPIARVLDAVERLSLSRSFCSRLENESMPSVVKEKQSIFSTVRCAGRSRQWPVLQAGFNSTGMRINMLGHAHSGRLVSQRTG